MVPGDPLRERSSPPDPGGRIGGMFFYIIIAVSYKPVIFRVFGKPFASTG
jgi:hypothetical protein